jgi:tetratricopeptide (TPR) repeat protein
MEQLKPLSKESIPKALIRAKHYRLLNEPWQASSICKDILVVEPENQRALLYLILAITDQFGTSNSSFYTEAKKLCNQLQNEYERYYYRGIIEERSGKAILNRSSPRVTYIAYEYYRNAMSFFEKADKISPEDNQDATLRWNACVRGIQEFNLKSSPDEKGVQTFLE